MQNSLIKLATLCFKQAIQHGPTHVCTVCHRGLFPDQVKRCNHATYMKNPTIVPACLTGTYVHVCSATCAGLEQCCIPQRRTEWICHSCDQNLKSGRMPSIAVANKLALSPIPSELCDLNILERQLLAKFLPFSKIVTLAKGKQRAIHGAVVCVPSEVEATVNSLPRSHSTSQLLKVKLKRRLSYKTYQQFQTVNMKNVFAGLSKLIETHSEYKDITINNNASFYDETLDNMTQDKTDDVEVSGAQVCITPSVTSVQASHCQAHKDYKAFSRNKQCTCMALTFLAHLNEKADLSSADLDNILKRGDDLYTSVKQKLIAEGKFRGNYLVMDEVPQSVQTERDEYTVLKSPVMMGYLRAKASRADRESWWLDLSTRLQCLSSGVNHALLIISPESIAVFRDKSGRYGFFDSHSRTADGLRHPGEGTAVMLTFTHLSDMVERIHMLFHDLSDKAQCDFMPVSFKSVHMPNDVPVQEAEENGLANQTLEQRNTSPLPSDENDVSHIQNATAMSYNDCELMDVNNCDGSDLTMAQGNSLANQTRTQHHLPPVGENDVQHEEAVCVSDHDLMEVDMENLFEQNNQDEIPIDENDGQDEQPPNSEEERDVLRPGLALDTCLQPVDVAHEILSYGEGIFSIAPAQGNTPVSFFTTPKLEAMAFPVQFPTGENTLDEEREIKTSPSMYFNARLFSVDTRFARDQSYLFFAQFVTEIHMAKCSMSIQLRKGKPVTRDGRKICNRLLQDKREIERLIQNKDATRFMQPLRGTPAYWDKTLRDLLAMIRQLGKPTFFCTFSAAEMRWPEVITAIKAQQGEKVEFSDLDWNTKCDILRSNPVTVMRMFEKRVNALMRDLLMSEAKPIGEVLDYFYRVEFQARGSPHIHLMAWIKDAPVFGNDSDETVCAFIDRYITCQLPDPIKDPELYRVVMEVQMHSRNHSTSCRKGPRLCRFGFPKQPMPLTMITYPMPEHMNVADSSIPTESNENESDPQAAKLKLTPMWTLLNDPKVSFSSVSELLDQCNLTLEQYQQYTAAMSKSSVIIMKRDPKDCWVNGYNADLLRAWNANMDIQYILDHYRCVMYMLSYISKPEHDMNEYLKAIIQDVRQTNATEKEEMKQIMQAYSKHRQVSAQESVARTCSLPLKKCSRNVVFIPTDDNALKMSLPMSALENKTPESEDVWMSGLTDKYRARPETHEFESMCLADFASTCRVVYGRQRDGKNAVTLLNDMGHIQKRTVGKPAIIRYARFSPEKDPEKYYGRLLKLYLPNRSDSQLKTTRLPTYEEFYRSACVRFPGTQHIQSVYVIVNQNREQYEQHDEVVDRAVTEFEQNGPIEDAWSTFAPEVDLDRLECIAAQTPEHPDEKKEQDDIPDYSTRSDKRGGIVPTVEAPQISRDVIRLMYQNLNQTQASIFYTVRDWCTKRVCGQNPDQFFYFITGGAGCGKSHLIKCIHAEATQILRKLPRLYEETDISMATVLLTAFTGTAAFNISGKTLHSTLKLPRSLKPPYQGLGNTIDEVRGTLSNAEIIIIDEVSMVSKQLFAYVNWRLQQIKGSNKPFGGMSVLAVGDFHQLPPLGKAKALCVFEDHVLDFWQDHFQMITLTEIMRQKEDIAFAQLLNRIRVKEKTESLSVDDKALLSQAVTDPAKCPNDVIHIFATNKEVDEHNAATISALHSNIINIDADDYKKDPRTGQMQRQAKPFKCQKGELPDTIQAAEGARVMLIRNIDVDDGLVNGSFGKIAKIVTQTQNGVCRVQMLGLEFDHSSAGQRHRNTVADRPDNLVYIERTEENLSRKGVVRRQFPMKLAFACTTHKVQGMTTQSAVVSLKRIFEAGMAYVALSRTTSLRGLHITHMDEKKIYTNPEIRVSLQSMRNASLDNSMPLLQIAQTSN